MPQAEANASRNAITGVVESDLCTLSIQEMRCEKGLAELGSHCTVHRVKRTYEVFADGLLGELASKRLKSGLAGERDEQFRARFPFLESCSNVWNFHIAIDGESQQFFVAMTNQDDMGISPFVLLPKLLKLGFASYLYLPNLIIGNEKATELKNRFRKWIQRRCLR